MVTPGSTADAPRSASVGGAGAVSVIVVNYNGGDLVADAVEAVLGSPLPLEVIVLDNGSQDESLARLTERYGSNSRVRLIDNRANLGFAKAVNIGIRGSRGEYVLFLNPDCLVNAATLPVLLDALRSCPSAGMAGGLIRNPEGSEQAGCRRRMPTPWRSLVRALRLHRLFPDSPRFQSPELTGEPLPEAPVPVEAISGALMLIRRSVLEDVGFLDERYFLHVEDLDLCMRVGRAGHDILFVPEAEAVHYKSYCSRGRDLFVLWHKYLGMTRFYWRFYRREKGVLVVALATAGLWLHFFASAAVGGIAKLRRRVVSSRPETRNTGGASLVKDVARTGQGEPNLADSRESPGSLQALHAQRTHPPAPSGACTGLDGRNVLVTGATGFLGRHLVTGLQICRAQVSVLLRRPGFCRLDGSVNQLAGDLTDCGSLQGVCSSIHTVFHLASYADEERDDGPDGADPHWRVTVEGTRALLAEAVSASVQRFVFVSSVKAMGEGGDQQLHETSPEAPQSAYGRAKLAAERLVAETCDPAGIERVVLRLPVVYGRDGRGNLRRMVAAMDRGWFPALPEVRNRRSLVHVDDVVQALLLAALAPQAAGRTYIVTDGEVYSTRQMQDLIRAALGRSPLRWGLPWGLVKRIARLGDLGGKALGRRLPLDSRVCDKLFSSAWYSSEKIARELGYRPLRTLRDALPEIIAHYQGRQEARSMQASALSGGQPQPGRQ